MFGEPDDTGYTEEVDVIFRKDLEPWARSRSILGMAKIYGKTGQGQGGIFRNCVE